MTLNYSTLALLRPTLTYITLLYFSFTPLDSTAFYHSTLLDSPLPCNGSTSLYMTLHYSTMALLYSTLHYLPCHCSTSHYVTQHYSNMAILNSTTLLYNSSTSLYLSLPYSIIALLHSTLLYITLPGLYFTLIFSILLYHASTSLYFTAYYSTMVLLHSTLLYITLP